MNKDRKYLTTVSGAELAIIQDIRRFKCKASVENVLAIEKGYYIDQLMYGGEIEC